MLLQNTATSQDLERLQELVLSTLTRPHTISSQLQAQLADQFSCLTEDQMRLFFESTLPTLEEYEVDLLFSPHFTAKMQDKLAFLEQFSFVSIRKQDIEAIGQAIESQTVMANFELPSGLKIPFQLKSVMVERFVMSLQLHKPLAPEMVDFIKSKCPECFQAVVSLALRDDIFKFEKYQQVFKAVCEKMIATQFLEQSLLMFLRDSIKTYTPQNVQDLSEKLDRLIQSCQDDIATADTRSYHHPHIQSGNMGSEHDHHEAEAVRANYQRIIEQSKALKALLEA
jgi:hypothetical protein